MNTRPLKATGLEVISRWDDCPCGGRTLDRLIQPAILIVLAAGPLHGYRLAEKIGELTVFRGGHPDASGVYRYLKTMETKGLVESSWVLSEAGPAKRSYRITGDGERCLRKWIATLEAYRDGISGLLKAARKAVAEQATGKPVG